jgi:hypothetical protein
MHPEGVSMKYTGSLNKAITRKRLGGLAGEDAYKAEAMRITDEMFKKFPALFSVHGVADGDWMGLAMALAKSHVPGFRSRNSPGRKTEWSVSDKAEFRLDVDINIASTSLSVVEAIKHVIRTQAWATKTASTTIGALEQHYYKADMRWVQVVKNARAYVTRV